MRYIHKVYMPTIGGNGIHIHHIRKKNMQVLGTGFGSVLLQPGGSGSGSSYSNVDDYIATTGVNPYENTNAISGRGLSKVQKSLASFNIMTPSKKIKAKNINFSL